ncbi:MAG: DUF885 domain-containing protein [Sphingomonadaceae bacterium]
MTRAILALLASTVLAACAAYPAAEAPQSASSTAPAAQSEHDRLVALFAEAEERELENNPLTALMRGDRRYADRLGALFAPEYDEKQRANAQASLAALSAIDRTALSETDRIAYDTFAFNQKQKLAATEPDILALTSVRPLDHFNGFHKDYPTYASGSSAIPFDTLADYENNLKRHAQYAEALDRSILRFREGLDSGVLNTALTTRNMIEQLDFQLGQSPEDSPYYGPVKKFPDAVPVADRARLTAAYRETISGAIYPALRRLRAFLADEYLPKARPSIGLSQMKGGERLYAMRIEDYTTLPLTAEELHQTGLSEVARIRGEMEKVKAGMGFTGTLSEFFTFVRTDPQFTPASREALIAAYEGVGARVDAQIGTLFSQTPITPLEIRPVEPFREKYEAGGSYNQGAPDGSRPGVFYFNTYDLPSRPLTGVVTLYLHEAAPGHHFQISLAQENTALPDFLRFEFPLAYVEGWALYAETLGHEMGLYEDPVAHFGTLNAEIHRAVRLVVDTGMHAKGWSRQQAIDYMLANSAKGRSDVEAEIDRYIAWPGQALAYKVGALKIQQLRARAEAALGDDFDVRKFHEQVLGTGALPLPILEAKIDRWIAGGGG